MIVRTLGSSRITEEYASKVKGYKEYLNMMTALLKVQDDGNGNWHVVLRRYMDIDYMTLPAECVQSKGCVLAVKTTGWMTIPVKAMEMKYEYSKGV